MDDLRVLNVPGGGDSGPDHWHTHWEATDPRCERVRQHHWTDGTRDEWVAGVGRHLDGSTTPTIVAAHSLGNLAFLHWLADRPTAGNDDLPVIGALLVAPVDVETPTDLVHPGSLYARFAPIPVTPLPFPATVVSSSNDPWITTGRAADLAERWGADHVDLGPMDHLGSECRLGRWPRGRQLVDDLLARAGR